MVINLFNYLAVGMILYLLGLLGIVFNGKNIIIILMAIELILLAVNYNFIVFSVYLNNLMGELFALLILTVAAAESSIGLAILVAFYRVTGTIAIRFMNSLRD